MIQRRIRPPLRRQRAHVRRHPPLGQRQPSTTATTLSTVTRLLTPGHWNACTSGFGSARPLVSITM